MNTRTLALAAILALPASSILVGCDRKKEDTAGTDRTEQKALERDLDLAMKPDSAARPQLNDLPGQADSARANTQAMTPPPPTAPPPPRPLRSARRRRPPGARRRTARRARSRARTSPRRSRRRPRPPRPSTLRAPRARGRRSR